MNLTFIHVIKNKNNTPSSDPIITEALERFNFTAIAEFDNRAAMRSDLEFYISDQWDASIRNNRRGEMRPCLTINRLPQFTRQITNGLRQNMPQINTIPVNDADEDVADIFDGMMRHIQESSQAGIAYATANQGQVIAGLGFFRVVTEYINENSFDQEIKIKRIKNPLSVYVDPSAVEPDYSDARYMFITEDITFAEFKTRYPDKETTSNQELTGRGDAVKHWLTNNESTMRIAEYWTVEDKETETLYQLSNGKIVKKLKKGQTAVKERKAKERKVIFRMISGTQILQEQEWAGKYIPIIPVIGEDMDVDGERIIKGMVRDAQDPQRMYNYWASAQTEMIALAPKAPFIVEYTQIEGFKGVWDSLNTQNYAYLPYKATTAGGTPIAPPQRQNIEPPVQAMVQAMSQASEDLKATTGIYDANLGNKSNEISGKAINARKLQGDLSNYHYVDNFSYSMLYLGKILIDLIPKIYDTERVVRILGEDGTSQYKTINGPSGEMGADGIEKIYDVTTGQYDVVVEVGPSYKTKRQEATEQMTQVMQANPELIKVAGDILVKNMDWPGSQALAERLKKTLPPQLQDPEDGKQPIPPQIQQQMQQSMQMIQQLTETVHQLQDEKEQKKMELESKERIALEQITGNITLKAMEMEGGANHAILLAELKGITERMQLLNVNQPVDFTGAQPSDVNNPNSQIDNGKINDTLINNNAGASPPGM